MQTQTQLQQPLSFFDLFQASFQLYKVSFKQIFVWSLLFAVIGSIIGAALIAHFGLQTLITLFKSAILHVKGIAVPSLLMVDGIYLFAAVIIFELAMLFIMCGMYNTLYQHLINQPTTFKSTCDFAIKRIWVVLALIILLSIAMIVIGCIVIGFTIAFHGKAIAFIGLILAIIAFIVFFWFIIYIMFLVLLVASRPGSLFGYIKEMASLLWGKWWVTLGVMLSGLFLGGVVLQIATLLVVMILRIAGVEPSTATYIGNIFSVYGEILVIIPWLAGLWLLHIQNLQRHKNIAVAFKQVTEQK